MAMIDSLLIANRGEIARRIIRTARRLGIQTIAVHSDVDAGLPFVRDADQAICIGPAAARESYLDQRKILAAAKEAGAAAIHPGYGFLSENAEFAEAVVKAGLIWVGAPPAAIRAMGLKDAAKALMLQAGVPVTPGYMGDDQSPERLRAEADAIGYPVLIKAVAGGGGKGMRKVDAAQQFLDSLESCRREAASSFGDDRVLIEKYVERPRHIEVQVFGDTHGNVVHLFERDCSLQRRHQKVIEEAPAPGMDEATRAAICAAAVKAAEAVDYVGAGTIEFIADASAGLRADRIWFMEMNTRLQVEHPVTEAITGQDLVEWQLRVASGEPLPLGQDELSINGWAMEARLYAENPATGFLPSIGKLELLSLPADAVRVDSGVEQGDAVTPHYDPMIAKLIAHGSVREQAAAKLAEAADTVLTWPVHNNAGFLSALLRHPRFVAGDVDTGFIGVEGDTLLAASTPGEAVVAAAAARLSQSFEGATAWHRLAGFRLNTASSSRLWLSDGRQTFEASIGPVSDIPARTVDGGVLVLDRGWPHYFELPAAGHGAGGGASAGDGAILAPMPGKVIAVEVAEGERVVRGQKLVVLEAMKMEQAMVAPFDGKVVEVKAQAAGQVSEGALLVRLEAEAGA
jgi:3-methylcrotonyl-CoA carboxylase alpha subunit